MGKKSRFCEMDILKAIGFLMVFLVHYNQMFSGVNGLINGLLMYGQMGCQIFLVVTGYLCAASYERKPIENTWKYLKKKYYNLIPGYVLALIVYAVLNLLFGLVWGGSPFRAEYSVFGVVLNLSFLHGFVPFCNNNVVPGGWYVGTVMIAYALLPYVMPMIKRGQYARWIAPVVSCVISLLIGTVVGLLDSSLVGNNSFYYYSVICQAPALLTGISLYYAKDWLAKTNVFLGIIVFGAFSVITLGILAIGYSVLIPLIPFTSALSYVGLYVIVCKLTVKWKFELLQKIGRASYGNYLFHFIFAWFVPYAVKRMDLVSNGILFVALLIPCFALSCILGTAVYKLITAVSQKLCLLAENRVVRRTQ